MVDSGVAVNVLDADARQLLCPGAPFGPLLEGFVFTELAHHVPTVGQQTARPQDHPAGLPRAGEDPACPGPSC